MRGEISGRFPVDLLIVIFSISLDIVGQTDDPLGAIDQYMKINRWTELKNRPCNEYNGYFFN